MSIELSLKCGILQDLLIHENACSRSPYKLNEEIVFSRPLPYTKCMHILDLPYTTEEFFRPPLIQNSKNFTPWYKNSQNYTPLYKKWAKFYPHIQKCKHLTPHSIQKNYIFETPIQKNWHLQDPDTKNGIFETPHKNNWHVNLKLPTTFWGSCCDRRTRYTDSQPESVAITDFHEKQGVFETSQNRNLSSDPNNILFVHRLTPIFYKFLIQIENF